MVRPTLPDKKWNKIEGKIQLEEGQKFSKPELADKIWEIVEEHYK